MACFQYKNFTFRWIVLQQASIVSTQVGYTDFCLYSKNKEAV